MTFAPLEGWSAGIKRSDGRNSSGQAIDHELVEMLGSLEILQPMDAEVLERDVIWQSAVDQRMRGTADEHLPTVRRVRDPGGTVDVEPHVALSAATAPSPV